MKASIVLSIGLLAAIAGASHASLRPEPKPPRIEDDIGHRLTLLEQRVSAQQAEIATVRADNRRLRAELGNLAAINDHVALVEVHGYPTVRFNAVNLQVVNGTGDTGVANGTGNLLIGYNTDRRAPAWGDEYGEECSRGSGMYGVPVETREQCDEMWGGVWAINHKSGSHYLVVGDEHNYSQWSGALTGYGNTASSPWATVTAGYRNRASGIASSVSGGVRGVANGGGSSIGGGYENTASGDYATVAAGSRGIASGVLSSVTGGGWNEASGVISSVTGGTANQATIEAAAVSGGTLNAASGHWSSVSGGVNRKVNDHHGWAGGTY